MRSTILILLPFLSLCLCNPSPLPNIDKLGSGYDILFGNPHSIGTTDPGFRQNVYNTGIYTGELTPDQRFLKPNGTSVSICEACSLSFDTSFVSGGASYAKTLSVNVKTNFSLWVAAFKGSYDYQSVEKDTSTYARKLTKSTATCEVYCAVIETFTPPPFTQDFLGGVDAVLTHPYKDNQQLYQKFFRAFGTHVITNARMGGIFGEQSIFTSESWTKYSQSTSDISAEASASAFGASAAVSAMTKIQQEQAANFRQHTLSRTIYTLGGSIPADGKAETWASAAVAEPQVIKYELTSLVDLLTSDNFPNDPTIAVKTENLRSALADYCKQAVSAEKIDNCDPPVDPPPPPPPESFFGGMFQVDDCNRNNIVNAMTGALNCPSGYTPLPGARIKAPEGNMCGAVQSYCVNRNTPTPHTFGGIYEKNDFNSKSNFPNILNNNQFGCPSGFNTFQMERAIDPEILCGTNVFICLAGFTEGKNQIGGFYQVNDIGSDDNINNPFTSGPSCPPGYNPILYARIKAPEGGKSGVNTFLCILSR